MCACKCLYLGVRARRGLRGGTGSVPARAGTEGSAVPAAGSRVSQELRYTREKLGEEAVYTAQMLIQTARPAGANLLTPDALRLHLRATLAASKVRVSLYGK